MKVIFQDSQGKERQIGSASTRKEALYIINRFLDEHNYKSYYSRMWFEGNRIKIDVGSHIEFFYLENKSKNNTLEEQFKELLVDK